MKKRLASSLIVLIMLLLLLPAYAMADARFYIGSNYYSIDGVEQEMEVAPYIKDSRTFVPIRYAAYALGLSDENISWDSQSRTILLMNDEQVVQLEVGSPVLMVGGGQSLMEVGPEIRNGRACLPIALVARAFGCHASWDAVNQMVTISRQTDL